MGEYMGNIDFSKKLQQKLNEQLGFGKPDMPIQAVNFPQTTGGLPQETNDVPPASTNVTDGSEVKPISEPRDDVAAQKQGGEVNSEVLGEISSLLVTIGFLLSKEGIVPDKFNTGGVVDFLNTHFKQIPPVTEQPPCDDVTTPAENIISSPASTLSIAPMPLAQYANPQVNAFMEARKLLESKHAKNN